MATILLMNFYEENGRRLAAFLRAEHHEVRMFVSNQQLPKWLQHQGDTIDLIIIDASQNERAGSSLLAGIVLYRAQYGPSPTVLCVSRVYRGPQFQLDLEKKGARLVYV